MRRIIKSFTLDSETIDKLKKYSDKELITQSRAIERIINSFLETGDKKEPNKKEEPKKTKDEEGAAIKKATAETLFKNVPGEYTGDKVNLGNGNPKPEFID